MANCCLNLMSTNLWLEYRSIFIRLGSHIRQNLLCLQYYHRSLEQLNNFQTCDCFWFFKIQEKIKNSSMAWVKDRFRSTYNKFLIKSKNWFNLWTNLCNPSKSPVKICFWKIGWRKIRQIVDCYGIDISYGEKSISKQRRKTFRENSEIVFRENIVSAQYRLSISYITVKI